MGLRGKTDFERRAAEENPDCIAGCAGLTVISTTTHLGAASSAFGPRFHSQPTVEDQL
jgi:hypothetical protein